MSKENKKYSKLLKKWKSHSFLKRLKYRLIFIFSSDPKDKLTKNVYAFLVAQKRLRLEKRSRVGSRIGDAMRKIVFPLARRLSGEDGIGKNFEKNDSIGDKIIKSGQTVIKAIDDVNSTNKNIDEAAKYIRKEIKKSTSKEDLDNILDKIDSTADSLINNGSTQSKDNIIFELKKSVKDKYDEKRKEIKLTNRINNIGKVQSIGMPNNYVLPYYEEDYIQTRCDEPDEPSPFDDNQEPVITVDVGGDNDNLLSIHENDDKVIYISKKQSKEIKHKISEAVDEFKKLMDEDVSTLFEKDHDLTFEESCRQKGFELKDGLIVMHRINPVHA